MPITKKIKSKRISKKEVKKEISVQKIPDNKAYELIEKYKIPTVKYAFVKNEKQVQENVKKLGFPLVMKVSGNIIHKTEIGGIIKNINSEQDALTAFKKLMKIKGCESVLMQKQIEGIELIIGAKQTKEFGNVVSVGIGGIFVEVLKDISFRVCPITKEDAQKMLTELKGYQILTGARGKSVDINKIIEVILSVCKLIESEKFSEMDINPLICNENGCYAVDVRIIK
ncbi:MAG: acetate--CoA ligase family protein [Candidatus Aenigmatarchaeota archaeon]|nr:acetate--CoA ligase family protein [Candidatus Aenigmarchaeota archaeon]